MDTPIPESEGAPPRHLIALAVLGGWALHDFALFFAGPEPHLLRTLLPGTVLAITAGVFVVGALGLREALLALAVAALGALVLWPWFTGGAPVEPRWPLRLLAAVGALVLAAGRLAPALGLGANALGLALGAGVAALVGLVRTGAWPGASSVVLAFALANLLVPRGRPRPSRWRGALTLALLVVLGLLQRGATALRRADLQPPTASAASDAPNLLFVVLDTVRADHLGPYGAALAPTPNLDAFVHAHAVRYAQARATSSWTLPAHASLFTGRFPDDHGATRPRDERDGDALDLQAWPARPLRPDAETLAERLRARGYRTAAITANASFLRHEFGLDRGFERYDDRESAWIPEYVALSHMTGGGLRAGFLPYRDARRISDLALDWLAERPPGPFFLFLNYMDAHAPYCPPVDFDDLGEPRWPGDPRAPASELHALLYDRELAFLDFELARVLERLERSALLERTAVVITSDHGEAFGEHGTWLHGWDLYEEVLRVPLYVKPAGGLAADAPRLVETPVTGAHVFGLALRALGLEAPPDPEPGPLAQLHLTPHLMERWRERGVELLGAHQAAFLEGTVKHLVGHGGAQRSFDLSVDPGERRPLALDESERESVRARLAAWRAAHPTPPAASTPGLEGRDRERLRALGYTGDA